MGIMMKSIANAEIGKRLVIIGTSHISMQSLKEVEMIIEKEKPNIIALELDRRRLTALFSEQKAETGEIIRQVGLKGYIFAKLGEMVQRKLGEKSGVIPGSEMKLAAKIAKKHKIPIALIDQDIEVTLKKLSKHISWKEKWNFVIDLLTGPFTASKQMKELNFDLNKVPEDEIIERLMKKLKERYPNIYRVIVTERNQIIARNLAKIMAENPEAKIVAVMGAGHKNEVMRLIQ